MQKQCFVIMPFKQQGTPEYAHFRALFDNVLKPAIERFGYSVTRADDHKRVGSITKDIIVPLATADLVVADLTEVNPNVFYELGVRHALRGYGTIMIMDESQTSIPFDITAYRVIKFRGTLEGIGTLGRELASYVEQLESNPVLALKDNLVHDWLPSLPTNVLDSALGSEEGALRKQIQDLRRTILGYEEKYGSLAVSEQMGPTVAQLVQDALAEAKSGLVASELVEKASNAAQKGDTTQFLDALSMVLQLRTSKPTARHIIQLMHAATVVGMEAVSESLIEHGQRLYPSNREIKLAQFQSFAHSDNPVSRERARQGMLTDLGIQKTELGYQLTRPLDEGLDTSILGIMLDAFHADGLDAEALALLESAFREYPESSRIMRNYARALEKTGRKGESLAYYRRANLLPDADDTAAVWLGNELHNRSRHVDAAEAYLIGCLRDPDDAGIFIHFAEEVSRGLPGSIGMLSPSRNLPQGTTSARGLVARAIIAAISIGGINPDSMQRMRESLKRAEIDPDQLGSALDEGSIAPTNRQLRLEFAKEQLDFFRSSITNAALDFEP